MRPSDVIAYFLPIAKRLESLNGNLIPAAFTVAQLIQECGWSLKCPRDLATGQQSYNLFGIKADLVWKRLNKPTVTAWTTEYLRGKPQKVKAEFRAYTNYYECLKDHETFLLRNQRYQPAMQLGAKDPKAFARAVAEAGYATDPNYGDELVAIMERYHLV